MNQRTVFERYSTAHIHTHKMAAHSCWNSNLISQFNYTVLLFPSSSTPAHLLPLFLLLFLISPAPKSPFPAVVNKLEYVPIFLRYPLPPPPVPPPSFCLSSLPLSQVKHEVERRQLPSQSECSPEISTDKSHHFNPSTIHNVFSVHPCTVSQTLLLLTVIIFNYYYHMLISDIFKLLGAGT